MSTVPSTAKVSKYECLYTRDQKKAKTWHDGYLRLHHYNSKLILLSSDNGELASTFYRPPAFLTARIKGHSDGGRPLDDGFKLRSEEKLELDDGWLAEVGDLVLTSETNLSKIRDETREARKLASQTAHDWARAVDSQEGGTDSNGGRSSERYGGTPTSSKGKSREDGAIPSPAPRPSASTSSASTSAVPGRYQGFGIPPPRSYASAGKPSSTSRTSSSSTKASPQPPFRPSPSASTSTPRSKPYDRPQNRVPAISSPYNIPHSPAVSSPFRPPSFNRPHPTASRLMSQETGGVGSSALGKRSLSLDQNMFGDEEG